MKITLENFGPIHHFEFDLDKDIHLLYGKNSVGKSYAVYVVYLVVKAMEEMEENAPDFDTNQVKEMNKILSIKQNSENKVLDLTIFTEELFSKTIELKLLPNLNNYFLNSFYNIAGLKNELNNQNFYINIENQNFYIVLKCTDNLLSVHSAVLKIKIIAKLEKSILEKFDTFKLQFPKFPLLSIENLYRYCTFLVKENLDSIDNIFFLPASRSGLYTGVKALSPLIAELTRHRQFIKKAITLPSLTEPISDYYIALSSFEKKEKNSTNIIKLAKKIEEKILRGTIIYDFENGTLGFAPTYSKHKEIMDLSFVSSMIAEIAPIVAFIKNIVTTNTLLIIEEPEAHLHPEAQVALMELFTELPKYGVKVIMTSHSNYMFNKLSNMVLEQTVDKEKVACYNMIMTEKGSIDAGTMQPTDDGMEDDNFVETAEKLYAERLRIYQTLNEQQTLSQ